EQADGGTLFLDEIGEISPATQVKLLRFLQEHEFERAGGNQTIKADVRIVTATNRDLLARAKEAELREDLYYRLIVDTRDTPALPGAKLEELARFAIMKTPEHTGGSTSRAAEILGISARTIQYRLQQYGGTTDDKKS